MGQHRKNIIKLIELNSYAINPRQVFSDFIEMMAISLSNATDLQHFKEREAKYMQIISKYSKEQINRFPEMSAELVMLFEVGGFGDPLGSIFMEIDGGNASSGQFFTPYSVSRMMARINSLDFVELLKTRNYITLNEPACGSGGMVVAFAEEMASQQINFQDHILAICTDIDIRCVHMAYVQLSLLGIPAVITHGNTLTREEWGQWKTPMYIYKGFFYRKHMKILETPQSMNEEIRQPGPPEQELKIDIGEQMSLPFFV